MNFVDYLLDRGQDDAVVLVDGDQRHTYGHLRAVVAALVRDLGAVGLAPGTPVAIQAPNGVFWIAAYLAAMARGLVAVPLPTTLGDDEVAARIAWVGARAVCLGRAQERRAARVVPTGVPVLGEAGLDTGEVAPFAAGSAVAVDPDQDAAYLFTSGTTGSPRAVRVTHRNLRANTESILGYLDLSSADRMLVVLPFGYVFGASLLHTHLRVGATLVNQPSMAFPEAIVNRLATERCTGLAGVPSVFQLLMRASSLPSRPLPALRTIQQAGGRLAPAVLRELVAAQPQARVFVMYGQTEATARLSYLPPEELAARTGSIGRGIPGVELTVVGDDGVPVRPGEVGEILARGANVSPGYLRDPAATERKMPGGVLRTGDLATVDDDGYIYVVDRSEDFIKSWGYRIASQDVEAAAMEVEDLVAAAAVGVPDDAAGERVELVVVVRPGSPADADTVLTHLRGRLAKSMIPQRVHVVARLPLNANGKVDKRAVRALCGAHPESTPVSSWAERTAVTTLALCTPHERAGRGEDSGQPQDRPLVRTQQGLGPAAARQVRQGS